MNDKNEPLICTITDYGKEVYIRNMAEGNSTPIKTEEERYQKNEKDFGKNFCEWWLRTPGMYSNWVLEVGWNGCVSDIGFLAYSDTEAVRPAVWVNIQ